MEVDLGLSQGSLPFLELLRIVLHWVVLSILPKVFIVVFLIFYLSLLKVSNKVRIILLLTQSQGGLQQGFVVCITRVRLKGCVQRR